VDIGNRTWSRSLTGHGCERGAKNVSGASIKVWKGIGLGVQLVGNLLYVGDRRVDMDGIPQVQDSAEEDCA